MFRPHRRHANLSPTDPHRTRTHHQHGLDRRTRLHAVHGSHAASKHALEAITDALRLELQPWGIRVAPSHQAPLPRPSGQDEKDVDAWDATWSQDLKNMYREAIHPHQRSRHSGRRTSSAGQHGHGSCRTRPSSQVAKNSIPRGARCRHSGLLALLLPDRLNDWIITRIVKLPARR